MDAIEAILTRRSIREYSPKPVAEETVRVLIRAAMAAPSARNLQPWVFLVIDDRETLDAIPSFHPNAAMLRNAPLAIVVCADTSRQPMEGYWLQDCSAATQNILIAAHALGLGACWVGIQPRPEREAGVRRLLALPDRIRPASLVSLGYPAQTKEPVDRFDPTRILRNTWSGV